MHRWRWRRARSRSSAVPAQRFELLLIGVCLLVVAGLSVAVLRLRDRVDVLHGQVVISQAQVHDQRAAVQAVAEQQARQIDPGKVGREAARSTFTVRAGPASGSGFAAFRDGSTVYVVTNEHVVARLRELGGSTVRLERDGRHFDAQVVHVDTPLDIALIAVPDPKHLLHVLPNAYAHGHDPVEGDPVIAYGTPLGVLDNTIAEGIVSGLRPETIQTDAQVHPGNSGGPLLNRYGEVIGVVTAEAANPDDFIGGSGLTFALDFREACGVLQQAVPGAAPCSGSSRH